MLNAIGNGILTGLVLATFFGPIFFAVLDLGLKGNVRGAAYLAFGTFLSDILWVILIYAIAHQVNPESRLLQAMYVVGGVVLIGLGLQNLFNTKIAETSTDKFSKDNLTLLSKGFLINSSNPNVFFFWFGAVMVAVNKYEGQSVLVLVHFFSALLVVFATDFLKGYGASFFRPYVREGVLLFLGRLSGLIFIYFGLKLMFFH